MKVSIVTPIYDRAHLLRTTLERIKEQTRQPFEIIVIQDGDDKGETQESCEWGVALGLPVRHILRKNRPAVGWSNPAIPFNIGIRRAQGEILILQPPEVRFTKPTDLDNLVRPVEEDANTVCFSQCESLKPDGTHQSWYSHADTHAPGMNFCTAINRGMLVTLGGYDEGYVGYGFEDFNLDWRIYASEMKKIWAPDVIVQHQWHKSWPNVDDGGDCKRNSDRLTEQMAAFKEGRGTLIANEGINWGDIES